MGGLREDILLLPRPCRLWLPRHRGRVPHLAERIRGRYEARDGAHPEPMSRELLEGLDGLGDLIGALRAARLDDVVWAVVGGNPVYYF